MIPVIHYIKFSLRLTDEGSQRAMQRTGGRNPADLQGILTTVNALQGT